MNDLTNDVNATPEQVKSLPGHFPLDLKTIEVKFKGGLSHTLRRPTLSELLGRDNDLQSAIDIGKDGAYQMPDVTADEETDAAMYDKLIMSTKGYAERSVLVMHKAQAFTGMYVRELYVDEDATPFDENVAVIEEMGGDPPTFTVMHIFRQPTEEELRMYRRKMQTGQIKPGKRGRQQFVTRSTLQTAVDFYDKWIVKIDGATVDGRTFDDLGDPAQFKVSVDPLIKRMAVTHFAKFLSEGLLD